jgi:hypothetical protein
MKGQKTGGRKKGTPNKTTKDIRLKLQTLGCDPIEAMARIAMKAEVDGETEIALRAYKELAQYVAPKLRAIEVTEDRGETEPMTFNFNVLPAVSDVIVTRGKAAVKKGKIQSTEKAS